MSSRSKPLALAAIQANNDIPPPLDFSFKNLSGIQGRYIPYGHTTSRVNKNVFICRTFSLCCTLSLKFCNFISLDATDEEPRLGPHKSSKASDNNIDNILLICQKSRAFLGLNYRIQGQSFTCN